MDGPGSFESFAWMWTAMTAVMMLPSVVPAATLATAVGRSSAAFVVGYLSVWSLSSVVAFAAARVLMVADPWTVVVALSVAAAYQLSPLKRACLIRCRAPLGSLLRRGAFVAGVDHAVVCLGCCWGLMLALLALGAGSLGWMAAFGVVIFIEKATAFGMRVTAPVGVALLGVAVWIAL